MEGFNTQQNDVPVKPDNSMPLSIIGTIIGLCSPCCIGLVVGIIAIVFSSQVNSKYQTEDYAGAQSAAKNAKILGYAAIIIGIIGIIITIVQVVMMGGISGFMEQYQEIIKQYQ